MAASKLELQCFFYVLSIKVSVLFKLKYEPTRHPVNVAAYCASIINNLGLATAQLMAQTFCLFCSIRLGDQDDIYLVAIAGECWKVRYRTQEHATSSGMLFSEYVAQLQVMKQGVDEKEEEKEKKEEEKEKMT